MTEIEAIKAIQSNWPPSSYSILRDALTIAVSALTEQAERSKGCECCDTELHTKLGEKEWITTVKYYEIGNGGYHYVKPTYCPMCGRKLKEANNATD